MDRSTSTLLLTVQDNTTSSIPDITLGEGGGLIACRIEKHPELRLKGCGIQESALVAWGMISDDVSTCTRILLVCLLKSYRYVRVDITGSCY